MTCFSFHNTWPLGLLNVDFLSVTALWQVNLWLGIYKDAPLVPFLNDFQIESCVLRVKTHSTCLQLLTLHAF